MKPQTTAIYVKEIFFTADELEILNDALGDWIDNRGEPANDLTQTAILLKDKVQNG